MSMAGRMREHQTIFVHPGLPQAFASPRELEGAAVGSALRIFCLLNGRDLSSTAEDAEDLI